MLIQALPTFRRHSLPTATDRMAARHVQSASTATTKSLNASSSLSVVKEMANVSARMASAVMTAQNHFAVHYQMAKTGHQDQTTKRPVNAKMVGVASTAMSAPRTPPVML